MIKKAIIFTCVEIVIFFIISMTHAYFLQAPSMGGAFVIGFIGLFSRLIYGQIIIELILLTLLFYSAFRYKMLLAVMAVVLAYIVSESFYVTELSQIINIFKPLAIDWYINFLVMIVFSAIFTALILKEYMSKAPNHLG